MFKLLFNKPLRISNLNFQRSFGVNFRNKLGERYYDTVIHRKYKFGHVKGIFCLDPVFLKMLEMHQSEMRVLLLMKASFGPYPSVGACCRED